MEDALDSIGSETPMGCDDSGIFLEDAVELKLDGELMLLQYDPDVWIQDRLVESEEVVNIDEYECQQMDAQDPPCQEDWNDVLLNKLVRKQGYPNAVGA